MPAKILDGQKLAEKIKANIKTKIKKRGITPGLGIILVGENPASDHYVNLKKREGEKLGFYVDVRRLPKNSTQKNLEKVIKKFNGDEKIHGFIIQLPLPRHLNTNKAIQMINPKKDVDGFHPVNIGRLATGLEGIIPATPKGIMRLLEEAKINLKGKHAVVVGRSNIVGKPIGLMLLQKDATVTVCHSKTKKLANYTRRADMLVVSVGKPNLISGSMIKKGACVIDVGMNKRPLSKGGIKEKWLGDVDFKSASKKASWITPVPGGVGPMTVAMLLENTLKTATSRTLD